MIRQATYAEIRQALADALEAHGHMGRLCDGQILACPEWGIRMRLHTLEHEPRLHAGEGTMGMQWIPREAPIHVLVEDADAGDASRAMVVRCLNPDRPPPPAGQVEEMVAHTPDDAELDRMIVATAEAMLRVGGATSEPYGSAGESAVRKLLQMLLRGQAQLRGVREVMQELLEEAE